MKISKLINLVFTTILLLFFSNYSFGQKLEPKERTLEPDHTITSKILQKDFELFISFPNNYTTKDSITYPVLYVLDGAFSFPTIQGAHNFLEIDGTIEDVIIVGINSNTSGPTGRFYDYTISSDTSADRRADIRYGLPKGSFKSGGAAKFLESIKTEIIPFVDKNYKTNNDRGISGHSLGGMFITYCLLNSDGYFTRFGIDSPALGWNNEDLLKQASELSENDEWNIPPSKVIITVGALEKSMRVPWAIELIKYLEGLNSDKIDLEWYIFENEDHFSVKSPNLNRTIAVLYGKK